MILGMGLYRLAMYSERVKNSKPLSSSGHQNLAL